MLILRSKPGFAYLQSLVLLALVNKIESDCFFIRSILKPEKYQNLRIKGIRTQKLFDKHYFGRLFSIY